MHVDERFQLEPFDAKDTKDAERTTAPSMDEVRNGGAVLQRGQEGPAVGELQTRLRELGHYRGEITNVFDETTENAVRAFQQGRTAQTGQVGPTTLTAIERAEGAGDASPFQPRDIKTPFGQAVRSVMDLTQHHSARAHERQGGIVADLSIYDRQGRANAIDLQSPLAGVVEYAGPADGYGPYLVILRNEETGVRFLSGHMLPPADEAARLRTGDTVQIGQVIGRQSNQGTEALHSHVEFYGGTPEANADAANEWINAMRTGSYEDLPAPDSAELQRRIRENRPGGAIR